MLGIQAASLYRDTARADIFSKEFFKIACGMNVSIEIADFLKKTVSVSISRESSLYTRLSPFSLYTKWIT
jgi:hypothetical protein